ncbi:unnamed protein product (macronuclear) [Paramecium tetraurelia]|uniref:GATA-type domain-containing protein n=1 Tax=Paramecium tetraurelia TaxID=5888 RepID=A0D5H6_PARTE|nr:uncharacterized protein GSPATT00039276001 [Paramecium tetraurelia]CAK78293.1 unnamed protein product [Paramecium tetraurelia]|eukprot:XP_001445690.1 hypothetical protein (macronuclear) [Paramecium tetraurelia strain d4-2]
MNFFHPLLQSLQFMRFNLSGDRNQTTLNLMNPSIKVEENDQVLPPIYQMTQQEMLQRQLVDTNARVMQFDGLTNEKEIPKTINKKISKKINTCGHPDKEHYAKGMCNNCYHRVGRNKQPWLCSHKKLYACGLCQNCYINQYNKKRRVEYQDQQQQQESALNNQDKLEN